MKDFAQNTRKARKIEQDETSIRFTYIMRIFILVIGAVLLFVLVRNIYRMSLANTRIEQKQAQLERLQNEQEELNQKLTLIESEQYKEFVARNQLGFAKEDEVVLVLPDDELLKSLAPKRMEGKSYLAEPNWKGWVELFM